MHDQISKWWKVQTRMMRLCSVHSIFSQWKSKRVLATYMYVPCIMLDSSLEIRIVGSYGCLQLSLNMKNKYIDLSFLTGWWKASTTSAHKEGWHITGWYRSHVDKSVCWCITSHPRTPSASTLYTSYQYTWFPAISSYCCPSVAWEACGSRCKQSWWRQTGLHWSQPQDHLGLII